MAGQAVGFSPPLWMAPERDKSRGWAGHDVQGLCVSNSEHPPCARIGVSDAPIIDQGECHAVYRVGCT